MRLRLAGRVYVCACAVFLFGVRPAASQTPTIKVGFWNIMSGKGVDALSGHAASFHNTGNCTDPSQPLNAWGVGASQAALAPLAADPSVVALGLAESWASVCGSPEHVRQALGWKAASSEQNGVALVARYGFAGPEQWVQLDTSLNKVPADTAWVLRRPVCIDAACTASLAVFVGHWYGTGSYGPTVYQRQADQTAAFLTSTAQGGPQVFVGDLNTWEGTTGVCGQYPNNTALGSLRAAGYMDAWLAVHGGAEGYTGMANRAGCGYPEGYAWKRVDYAWTPASYAPLAMQRFAVPAVAGDASPSDHYGILVTLPSPVAATTPSAPVLSAPPAATPPPASTTPEPTTSEPTTSEPTNTASTPVSTDDIVLYAKRATVTGNAWTFVDDSTAAGGVRLANADAGGAKLAAPSAAPASFVELPFTVEPGRAYHVWLRGKAQNDSWQNDSTFVQFSGSVTAAGAPVFRIGSTSAAIFSIEEGNGAGVAGWGWQDSAYGFGALADPVYFESASQVLRVQVREDGLSFDQIVLSPVTFAAAAPGAGKNDATLLPETVAAAPANTDVTWTSLVKAGASGAALQKTSGCSGCFDAGAISTQALAGDGAFSFAVARDQRLFAGLSHDTSAATSYAAIDYAFSFWPGGIWEIREGNSYRTEGAAAAGDVFTITVTSGVVRYYRNDTLVYTSAIHNTGPLVADTSLSSLGPGVASARIVVK